MRASRSALNSTDSYPLGVKISDWDLAAVPLHRHGWHGEWNSTVLPAAAQPHR
jgi:hypothetical protein